MKVVHLLNNLMPSGMERMLVSAAPYFAAEGCTSSVVGQNIFSDAHPFVNELRSAGYDVTCLEPVSTAAGFRSWVKEISSIQPDVVHIHPDGSYLAAAVGARLGSRRARIVRTVHNIFTPPTAKARLRRKAEYLVADRLVSTVAGVSSEVVALEGSRRRKIVLVENWVADQFFELRGSPTNYVGDTCNVLLLGNCSDVKNHIPVIEAVLARDDMRLLHLGSEAGASNHERTLLDMLEELNRVITRGVGDPFAAMTQAHVFAMPSVREGASIALLEALVAGLPCVLNDTPAFRWAGEFDGVRFVEDNHDWLEGILQMARAADSVGLQDKRGSVRRFAASEGVRRYLDIYTAKH